MNILQFLDLRYTAGSETRLPCLWCQAESCIVQNEETNIFQCWGCNKTGNAYSILQKFYEDLPKLRPADARELQKLKPGIDIKIFAKLGVRRDKGKWYWPVRSKKGKVHAMYKYTPSAKPEYRMMSSPKPTTLTVLGLDTLKSKGPIWIAEGHWDYAALLSRLDLSKDLSLLGTAGSAYPSLHFKELENRNVVLLYDNDDAGRQGIDNLASRMKKKSILPASLQFFNWKAVQLPSGEVPNKYDMRDLVQELKL